MLRKIGRWTVRIAIAVVVLLLIAVISDRIAHRVQSGTVLVVTFKGPVVERGTSNLLGIFSPQETPLNAMRVALAKAATDPRIVGLAIKMIDTQMELSQAQEIAAMIRKFKDQGKWASAYIETSGELSAGNLPYLVAAATGEVSLMPEGELDIVGVGIREIFARGTLDWLGVRPNFASLGKYKSAANMFTEKDFTGPQREEDEALVGNMFDQIVGQISQERGISVDQMKALVDQAPLPPEMSLKSHLIERIEYEDQFTDRMKRHGGSAHAMLGFTDYVRPNFVSGFASEDQIAVVYCDGEITRGEASGFGLAQSAATCDSDDLVDAFKKVREDDSIRAVIFRVDSPGGSVVASELIRRSAELTARNKPMVVSMSGYAASGGYWVSMPSTYIVAEPGTITGSIGVLGGKFNLGPAAQKIYLNSGPVSRGANVEMFDEFTDFNPDQMKIFQDQILGNTYQKFLKVVADSRHMSVDNVNTIAQGRVWTGQQALPIKLIDKLGGFSDALAQAKKMAKLPPDREVALFELPTQAGALTRLLGSQAIARAPQVPAAMRSMLPALMMVKAALSHGGTLGAVYCPVVPIW